MAQVAGHFNLLIDAGWKLREIGDRYGLSAALVHRIAHGQIDYSAPAVLGVLDIPTVEVRAVIRLAPGAPPPPPILFLDATGAEATVPEAGAGDAAEVARLREWVALLWPVVVAADQHAILYLGEETAQMKALRDALEPVHKYQQEAPHE